MTSRRSEAALRSTLVARRYVRRARGPRLTVLSTYLEIAATSAPAQNESDAKMRLWNLAPIVYTVDSPVPSSAMPQRLLRNDAADRLIRGAIAVGRMRTRRCGRLECDGGAGTPLSQSNTSALCSACMALDPFAEPALRRAENEVFAAAAKSLAR